MAYTVKQSVNGWMVKDDGYTASIHATEAEALAEVKNLERADVMTEVVEDAIIELKQDLVRRFGITLDEAHKLIKEVL